MTPQQAVEAIHRELGIRTVIVAEQHAHFATVMEASEVAKRKWRVSIFETGDASLVAEYGQTLEEAAEKAIAKAKGAGMRKAA